MGGALSNSPDAGAPISDPFASNENLGVLFASHAQSRRDAGTPCRNEHFGCGFRVSCSGTSHPKAMTEIRWG